jgi:uncharacterized protein (DUF4415 family)
MKKTSNKKSKEVAINVTEEDHQRSKMKGIREEALLKPGLHKFVRGANPLIRAGLLPATSPKKVRISILLDEDIIEHFKKRASMQNALPYQTQINNELRAVLMRDRGVKIEVEDEDTALHKNPILIDAVTKIVREQLAQKEKPQRKRA